MPKSQPDHTHAPSTEVIEEVGYIATQQISKKETVDNPAKKESKKDDDKDGSKEKIVAGYSIADLAKAPLTPPEQKKKDTKRDTSNRKVIIMVFGGALVALLGLILLFFVPVLAVLLIVIGGISVSVAVLAPVRTRRSHSAAKSA